jgi:hypothetical protein
MRPRGLCRDTLMGVSVKAKHLVWWGVHILAVSTVVEGVTLPDAPPVWSRLDNTLLSGAIIGNASDAPFTLRQCKSTCAAAKECLAFTFDEDGQVGGRFLLFVSISSALLLLSCSLSPCMCVYVCLVSLSLCIV